MHNNFLYQIALTLIPQIGCVQARILLEHLPPEEIFKAKASTLEKIDGLGEVRVKQIKAFNQFEIAEFPNLNHLFQEAKTGDVDEYAQLEQTISPAVLEKMSSWILKR